MVTRIRLRIQRWVQPELDRTMVLLGQANTQLDHALRENLDLRRRNTELHSEVAGLRADNAELHRQVELLKQANQLQNAAIERMERYQRELQNKYDNLYARVVQLQARLDRQ